jgi:hypothetical protein
MFMVMLVLGLSMAPCCTPVIGNGSDQNKQVNAGSDCCKSDCGKENQNADDPLPSENTCGTCSPFYTCGSCTGYTFQDIEYSEYFNLKWQPPKLSLFFS